jgi:hypothetical protein
MVVPPFKLIRCPILVGRQAHLDALGGLIGAAQSGQGQVALLAGEAGIGKSRLAAEVAALAAAQGFAVLQGYCFQPDVSSPYAPLLDLLRSSFAHHAEPARLAAGDTVLSEIFQLLPGVVPLPPELAPTVVLEPEAQKRRLFTALTHYFARRSPGGSRAAIFGCGSNHPASGSHCARLGPTGNVLAARDGADSGHFIHCAAPCRQNTVGRPDAARTRGGAADYPREIKPRDCRRAGCRRTDSREPCREYPLQVGL